MKRIKYIAIGGLSVATMLLGMSACSNLDELADNGDGTFALSASSSAVTVSTRAESTEQFAEGTKYYLYALDASSPSSPSWSANYMNATPDANYTIGTETSSHTIQYDGNNKFDHKTLNFYGVTESSTTENQFITAGNGATAPTVKATYAASTGLPDYMWANLDNQSFKNAGTITLPFIHTTSKLNFFVNAADSKSTYVIKGLSLLDYPSGSLDMTTGKFKSDASLQRTEASSQWNQVFSGTKTVTTESAALVERTVFPTRTNTDQFLSTTSLTNHETNSLGIRLSFTVNGVSKTFTYWTKEIMMDANNNPKVANPNATDESKYYYKPFQFDPNYQYDVQLTLTADALVVTILPRYYGWIKNAESQSNTSELTEIGNPVTFGGVVWADRNLGATSADPTASAMDWERSVGWFYQFGRSIPYYVKGSMQDPNNLSATNLVYGTNVPNIPQDNWNILRKGIGKPYPYVYGHYNDYVVAVNGSSSSAYNISKSYSDIYSTNNRVSTKASDYSFANLAKIPGATGKYNFVVDFNNGTKYPNVPYDWDYNHSGSQSFWDVPTQQPCPKGWRLPTKEEVLTIYPYDALCGDICLASNIGAYIIGQGGSKHEYSSLKSEDYVPYTTGVKNGGYYSKGYYIDYTGKDGQYVGVKNSGDTYATIYCIKNQGTDKAYRIKWSVIVVNDKNYSDSKVRQVLKIERFPSNNKQSLVSQSHTPMNVPGYDNSLDWSHPSEIMYLPLGGVMYARFQGDNDNSGVALTYPGVEAMYWTANANTDVNGNYSYSLRMRIDNTSDNGQKAVFRYGYDHRGWGGMIRCVRDDSVVDK